MVQSMTAIRSWSIWQQNKPKLSDQTNHIHFKLKGRFTKSGASLKILAMLLKPFRKKKRYFYERNMDCFHSFSLSWLNVLVFRFFLHNRSLFVNHYTFTNSFNHYHHICGSRFLVFLFQVPIIWFVLVCCFIFTFSSSICLSCWFFREFGCQNLPVSGTVVHRFGNSPPQQ